MARELTFVITAQTYEAEAKLRILENQIQQLNKDLEKGTITWEEYEKQLKGASAAAAAQRSNLEETRKSVEGTTKAVSPLTSLIMRYASGAVIGAAVKSTAAWASNLQDLSAKSSISVTQLQKLEVVAGRSGGSLEQIATAASMLLDKLGSNDKALIQAVSALGLNLYKLRSQDPGQTFIDLATAIAKVEDPAQRMALAVDVFGRQGRQLMPTIMEIGKGIGDIGTSSEETIEQLDALDAVMADLKTTGRGLLADLFGPWAKQLKTVGEWAVWVTTTFREMLTVLRDLEQVGIFAAHQRYLDRQLKPPGLAGAAKPPLPVPLITGELGDPTSAEYRLVVKDLSSAHKDAAKAARELAVSHRKLGLDEFGRIKAQGFSDLYKVIPDAGSFPGLMGTGEIPSWLSGGDLPSRAITTGLWRGPNITPSSAYRPGGGFLQTAFGGLGGLSGGLTNTILGALMGGGNVGQALGGFVGSGLGSWAGKTASTALGGVLGSTLGAVLPGIGALLGPLLGKLFGPSEATKTRKERTQFIEQFGGLEELRAQADLAHFSLDRLLSTKKTKTLEAEIKKLAAAMEATKKRVAEITDALERLNTSGGLISKGLIDKITYDLKNPAVQQAVFQFMQAQAQTALQALEEYVTSAQIRTTGGAQALAASAVAIFEELQRQGMSAVEALAALAPTLAALGQKFDELGLGGGEAFDTLRRLAGIAGDEVRGPLVQSIDTLTRMMIALGNVGLMTQEIFSGLTQEITATYQQLLELGTDSHDALLLLQAPLQRLYELQQRFGFQTDEATQALLDQAKAAGLVGDQWKSAQERMVDAINALIGRFDILLQRVYGIVPAADAAAGALEQIKLNPDNSGYWTGKPVNPDEELPEFARGSSGLRDFGRETVARLHGKEAVVTEAQWRALTSSSGITVHVDARGALLNDPSSQLALAQIVSDALVAQHTLQGPR